MVYFDKKGGAVSRQGEWKQEGISSHAWKTKFPFEFFQSDNKQPLSLDECPAYGLQNKPESYIGFKNAYDIFFLNRAKNR